MKKISIIFLTFVALIILIPTLRLDFENSVSVREKRDYATFPKILAPDNKVNFSYFQQMNAYLEDRIGLKNQYVILNGKLNDLLQLKNNYNAPGFYGKDDWLFYNRDGLLDSYLKTNLFSEEELEKYSHKIHLMQDWCEEHGIKFIFFVAPNKNEIYEEYFPIKRPEGINWGTQMYEKLLADGVNVIYPKEIILNAKSYEKSPLYFERDTHWNSKGAYYGSLPLVEKVKEFFPICNSLKIDYAFNKKEVPGGDLQNIIGTVNKSMTDYDTEPFIDGKLSESLFSYKKNEAQNGIITEGDKKLPKVIVFRDSFFVALLQFISPYFSEAEYIWKPFSEDMKDYVLNAKPDIVIFEGVERGAFNYAGIAFKSATDSSVSAFLSDSEVLLSFKNVEKYNELYIAVWSDENGQDDLKWYGHSVSENNFSFSLSDFNTNGKFFIHVYGVQKDTSPVFICETTMEMDSY